MGVLPSGARTNARPIWPVARRVCSPRSGSNFPSSFGGGLDLLRWDGGWGVFCGLDWRRLCHAPVGGSKSAPRSSGSGVARVPVLTAGERCVLAASECVNGVVVVMGWVIRRSLVWQGS